ncbi:MAG: NAD-dependent protein deacylase [Gammaproteobacteria bacterium]|nr:MAG: NAD-dependent protein deacylase [Gammaproteobacteria bacterium]
MRRAGPEIDVLAAALRVSRRTVVLTGAGVSAESGIPTFRDPQDGLWARYRAEDLATPEAFARDPRLVWQWYQWRREAIAAAKPNAAHLAIAALDRLLPSLVLVTQNVDGLHQQAGSRSVLELHGNILRNRCSRENRLTDIDTRGTSKPPRCPSCGAYIRPDVVWFGEPLPPQILAASQAAAGNCDLLIAVGTSSMVMPAAGLIALARSAGARFAEVNPQETLVSSQADISLRMPAGEAFPAVLAALD